MMSNNRTMLIGFGLLAILLIVIGVIGFIALSTQFDPQTMQGDRQEDDAEKVYRLMRKFDDVAFVANLTPQDQLTVPLLEMQDIRYEMEYLEVSDQSMELKTSAHNYMTGVITYLAHFMGGADKEDVNLEIIASGELRRIYEAELYEIAGQKFIKPTRTVPVP